MNSTIIQHPEDGGSIFGHRPGLFVLFFTEMWERFSYYGMRALLVLFLTASLFDEGWAWSRGNALQLYGMYTGLVYLTPIIGGIIADKLLGYRRAVVLGAFIMTLGHAFMAFETPAFFYLGLAGLILGNGLFKPNISSIVGQLYSDRMDQKDGAYTIFYMGINAGAFLGILLCGYIGEKVGWSYGFGLAGVFMFFGMLQFYFAQNIFGSIGLSPKHEAPASPELKTEPVDQITDVAAPAVERDRVIVIGVFAFFTIFFWWAFEQAGGSMTIFAADYTDRILTGGAANAFKIINTLLIIVPLGVITWVLFQLFRITFSNYALANVWLGLSFLIIWGIAIWLIQNDWNTRAYEITYTDALGNEQTTLIGSTEELTPGASLTLTNDVAVELVDIDKLSEAGGSVRDGYLVDEGGNRGSVAIEATLEEVVTKRPTGLFWTDEEYGRYSYQDGIGNTATATVLMPADEDQRPAPGDQVTLAFNDAFTITNAGGPAEANAIQATVVAENDSQIEIAASWFGILNSFFIIVFAPLFGRFWQTGIITSGPLKFALGLSLLGLGFGFLAFGSMGIPIGARTAGVSILWLILAYLFHTLGELCVSPVGLSYVSKLAPVRLVGLMFGIWFIANFIANAAAGFTGSYIDPIVDAYGMAVFFLIFTVIPIAAALILVIINGWMKKMMHGIE
jgi:dipeptide/tripeptide permease